GGTGRGAPGRQIARGDVSVVVGARSALFLPLSRLGLIVIDEEHDSSYKQEEGVIYHARDMAVVRARLAEAPIVLVSATPSLETLTNAPQGRYPHLHLPDRHRRARHRRPPAAARPLADAAAGRCARRHAGARRAGDAVPQPPGLCAAHLVPRLRSSAALPAVRHLAGRASTGRPADLPPLRPRR